MNLAIDTNRYVDFMKGVPEAVATLRAATTISVPLIVIGELRAGFLSGTKGRANEAVLVRFLDRDRVRVLRLDEGTTHLYARVFSELERAGVPIPTNDMWIAALVMQNDLPLYTRDRHFDQVNGVAVL